MPCVPYNAERHWRPVSAAFCLGTGLTRAELRRMLMLDCRCQVYEGVQPVEIKGVLRVLVLGFVVVRGANEVVWTYTIPTNRKNGIMVRLLDAAGIDTTEPMVMATRTPASDEIVRELVGRGWKIELKDKEEQVA